MTGCTAVARGLGAAAVIAAALWGAGCAGSRHDHDPRVALAFTLKDMNGRDVSLASLAGKPLIVNFWATWCGPCRLETPQLEALSRRYRDRGLVVLGISTDDEAADIRRFADQFKVSYPLLVGLNRTDVQAAFGWEGLLPTSVLVRKDGTIADTVEGIQTEGYWTKQIQALF
jgi:thiol-disulfide isomerase/thioredoxin